MQQQENGEGEEEEEEEEEEEDENESHDNKHYSERKAEFEQRDFDRDDQFAGFNAYENNFTSNPTSNSGSKY